MIWDVLGIEETKDLKAIKAAYLNRLKSVNPEDSPEKFMELRSAYEEATQLAQAKDTEEADDEISVWIRQIEEVYWDFAKRRDAAVWRELLCDRVCTEIGTKKQAEGALLRFLMVNWHLSQNVWQELDIRFGFTERVSELYEVYPRIFVDNVILRGISDKENLPFELFTPGIDGHAVDEYINTYNQRIGDQEKPEDTFAKLQGMKERHPYGDALAESFFYKRGDDGARDRLLKLVSEHPGNKDILVIAARTYAETGNNAQALKLLEEHILSYKDDMRVRAEYAMSLAQNERFREAYEEINLIVKRFDDADIRIPGLGEYTVLCCRRLIAMCESDPDRYLAADEDKVDLAWWYMQTGDPDRAYEIMSQIADPGRREFSYHNGMCGLHMNRHEYESALEDAKQAVRCISGMTPDGTERRELDMKRMPEMRMREAECYRAMGKNEEAEAIEQSALQESLYSAVLTNMRLRHLLSERDYPAAVVCADMCLNRHTHALRIRFMKAMALFNMHANREAYDEFSRVIESGLRALAVYVIRIQILIREHVFTQAREELDRLINMSQGDDLPDVKWLEAYLELEMLRDERNRLQTGQDEERKDDALKRIGEREELLLSRFAEIDCLLEQKGYQAEWRAEFYRQYALFTEAEQKKKTVVKMDDIVSIIDKGLKADGQNADLLLHKARYLISMEDLEQGYDLVYRAFKIGMLSRKGVRDLARYCFRTLPDHADRAYEVYDKLIGSAGYEDDPKAERIQDRFQTGYAALRLGDHENALLHFGILQSMDKRDPHGYIGSAAVSLAMGDPEKAIEYADCGLEMTKDWKNGKETVYELVRLKVTAFRRLGRCDDAVSAAGKLDREEYRVLIHRIYMQFGRVEEDRNHLTAWKEQSRKTKAFLTQMGLKPFYPYARDPRAVLMEYWLLRGEPLRARFIWTGLLSEIAIGKKDYEERSDLDACSGMFSEASSFWAGKASEKYDYYPGIYREVKALLLKRMENTGHIVSREVSSAGKILLSATDRYAAQYTGERSMHLRNRIYLLAVLGKREEAIEALRQMRANPLCESCPYSTCAEADICEMYIEAFTGKKKDARRLCAQGLEKWPGEMEFRIAQAYLK